MTITTGMTYFRLGMGPRLVIGPKHTHTQQNKLQVSEIYVVSGQYNSRCD